MPRPNQLVLFRRAVDSMVHLVEISATQTFLLARMPQAISLT